MPKGIGYGNNSFSIDQEIGMPAVENDGNQELPAEDQPPAEPMEREQPKQGQDEYTRLVVIGMRFLYQEKNDEIMEMLEQGAQDPPRVIAQVTQSIMAPIKSKVGQSVPASTISQVTTEILSLVAEMGDKAGFFVVDQDTISKAVDNLIPRRKTPNRGQPRQPSPEEPAAQAEPTMPQGGPGIDGIINQAVAAV